MIKIREGNLSLAELLLNIKESIIRARKYSDTAYLVDLKSALRIIHGAANDRGDPKTAGIAMDMESAIDDWLQREDDTSFLPSDEKILSLSSSAED
jgi:hypothetical protein